MMTTDDLLYIWQQPDWPHWRYDAAALGVILVVEKANHA